jgi:hypothetical protein
MGFRLALFGARLGTENDALRFISPKIDPAPPMDKVDEYRE